MIIRDLHRGDIYQYRISHSCEFPFGTQGFAMVVQNDAGEIPNQTLSVLFLKRSNLRNLGEQPQDAHWHLADRNIHRLDKRQLVAFCGVLSPVRVRSIMATIEKHTGVCIPEIIEAP